MSLAVFLTAGFTPTGASSRTRTVISAVQAVGAAMTARFVVRHIRARLAKIRAEIPARRAELHGMQCRTHGCYERAEVNAAVLRIRTDVQAAFPEKALASRISLDEEIMEAAAVIAPEQQASIQLIRNAPDATPSTIDGRNVDTTFGRISARIDHYLAHPDLNPTIRIKSEPAGAKFEMQVGANAGTKVEGLTNNELQSVWRGRYRGHAHKTNYRDADDPIDLFNDRRTKVQCKLVEIRAAATEESHCWLED